MQIVNTGCLNWIFKGQEVAADQATPGEKKKYRSKEENRAKDISWKRDREGETFGVSLQAIEFRECKTQYQKAIKNMKNQNHFVFLPVPYTLF